MVIENNLTYIHKVINSELFIFPITGLVIGKNNSILVGNIEFVDKNYLNRNINV